MSNYTPVLNGSFWFSLPAYLQKPWQREPGSHHPSIYLCIWLQYSNLLLKMKFYYFKIIDKKKLENKHKSVWEVFYKINSQNLSDWMWKVREARNKCGLSNGVNSVFLSQF